MKRIAERVAGSRSILLVAVFVFALSVPVVVLAEQAGLKDKTLVVWVSPANLSQRGGSALTVNDTTIDRFDGVVFGELEESLWMPGSNHYSRTHKGTIRLAQGDGLGR